MICGIYSFHIPLQRYLLGYMTPPSPPLRGHCFRNFVTCSLFSSSTKKCLVNSRCNISKIPLPQTSIATLYIHRIYIL